MPFSEFGRPKADLNIQIDNSTIHPGDELEARVELLPREDFHVRLGKVELVCVETCVQTTRSQYGVHYSKRTHTRTLAEETFMDDKIVRRWGGLSTDVRFIVPPDALPSLSGTTVQKIQPSIAWAVTAFLDVTKARDMRQRQEFTVVRPTALEDPPPSPIVAESRHRQCVLTLSLSRSDARSGDRIDGSLRAEMLEEVSASEVRVELVRVEKFGNESQDHSVDVVTLERDPTLQSGQTRQWPVQLDVAHVGVPSLTTEKSSVRWLVKGILDRRMRRDLRVEQEISVDF